MGQFKLLCRGNSQAVVQNDSECFVASSRQLFQDIVGHGRSKTVKVLVVTDTDLVLDKDNELPTSLITLLFERHQKGLSSTLIFNELLNLIRFFSTGQLYGFGQDYKASDDFLPENASELEIIYEGPIQKAKTD